MRGQVGKAAQQCVDAELAEDSVVARAQIHRLVRLLFGAHHQDEVVLQNKQKDKSPVNDMPSFAKSSYSAERAYF